MNHIPERYIRQAERTDMTLELVAYFQQKLSTAYGGKWQLIEKPYQGLADSIFSDGERKIRLDVSKGTDVQDVQYVEVTK